MLRIAAIALLAVLEIWQHAAPPRDTAPVVRVPRGAAITIDGKADDAEWRDAVSQPLSNGGTLWLKHDDRFLYLAVRTAASVYPSVCVQRGDTIRIVHASAALGIGVYTRSGSAHALAAPFTFGMRNVGTDAAAIAERRAFLVANGWLASTVRMGNERDREMQIPIAFMQPGAARLGLGLMQMSTDGVLVWPVPLTDACGATKMVQGFLPERAEFNTALWAELVIVQ